MSHNPISSLWNRCGKTLHLAAWAKPKFHQALCSIGLHELHRYHSGLNSSTIRVECEAPGCSYEKEIFSQVSEEARMKARQMLTTMQEAIAIAETPQGKTKPVVIIKEQ